MRKKLPAQYHPLLRSLEKADRALAAGDRSLARALLTAVQQAEDLSLPVCCYCLSHGAENALEAMDGHDGFGARQILKTAREDAEADRRLHEEIIGDFAD